MFAYNRNVTLLLAVYQRYKKTTAIELAPLIYYKPMIEVCRRKIL
jgi:hypothetical protein